MNATARNTGAGHWQYGSQARPYHYPQVRDAIEGNPRGVVSSSPGLRACELPWDIVQTASQPQRGCGRARHPRTQPRWGWLVPTRWSQCSSFLATLCCRIPSGFAPLPIQDAGNDTASAGGNRENGEKGRLDLWRVEGEVRRVIRGCY